MKRIGAVGMLLLAVGALVAFGVNGSRDTVLQPVVFNHLLHIKDASLECQACHKKASSSRYAGLPETGICTDCHDSAAEKGARPEKDKLFAYADRNPEIPWDRVAVTRPDVFFSHRRHVTSAKIGCLDCHLRQDARTRPPSTRELVMRMADCIACHQRRNASTDCLACHR